jgi:hypothetical protein
VDGGAVEGGVGEDGGVDEEEEAERELASINKDSSPMEALEHTNAPEK